jgi:excisionase family DNA binding protein
MAVAVAVQPALFTINETARVLSVCRRTIYELVSAGKLDAVKLGKATRITAKSLNAFIANVPKAKINLPTRAERLAKAKARAQAGAR